MIYFGFSKSLVDDFKSCMMTKSETTDLRLLRYFLGLKVTREENGIFVYQKKYIVDLFKRFRITKL